MAGAIYTTHDSVYAPIFELIRQKGGAEFMESHCPSISSLATRASMGTAGKPRPCIDMEGSAHQIGNLSELKICMMATFEGDPFEHLPIIIQHFTVPMFPNDGASYNPTHQASKLATYPAWHRTNQWVIACTMKTRPHRLAGKFRVRCGYGKQPNNIALTSDSLERLNELCVELRLQFDANVDNDVWTLRGLLESLEVWSA